MIYEIFTHVLDFKVGMVSSHYPKNFDQYQQDVWNDRVNH